MVVAVTPTKASGDRFWIAKVTFIKTNNLLVYHIQYYNYNKTKKCWVIMKEKQAYGTCPHDAIIAANIEFNNNMTIKSASIDLINKSLVE